ncbi:hypothetical protein ACFQMM_24185 [Saliphagus sp. GCM10025308]
MKAESRTLSIRIDELEYTLALLDPETIRSPREGSSDAFDLAGAVVASAETFDRSVRAAEMVSTHLEFELDAADEVFEVRADGDTDDVSLTLSAADLVDLEPADAVSLFSVDYLASINRAMPGGVDVGLGLGTEKPLSIRYEFAEEAATWSTSWHPGSARPERRDSRSPLFRADRPLEAVDSTQSAIQSLYHVRLITPLYGEATERSSRPRRRRLRPDRRRSV